MTTTLLSIIDELAIASDSAFAAGITLGQLKLLLSLLPSTDEKALVLDSYCLLFDQLDLPDDSNVCDIDIKGRVYAPSVRRLADGSGYIPVLKIGSTTYDVATLKAAAIEIGAKFTPTTRSYEVEMDGVKTTRRDIGFQIKFVAIAQEPENEDEIVEEQVSILFFPFSIKMSDLTTQDEKTARMAEALTLAKKGVTSQDFLAYVSDVGAERGLKLEQIPTGTYSVKAVEIKTVQKNDGSGYFKLLLLTVNDGTSTYRIEESVNLALFKPLFGLFGEQYMTQAGCGLTLELTKVDTAGSKRKITGRVFTKQTALSMFATAGLTLPAAVEQVLEEDLVAV
jgi:hypothetical protein